MAGLKVIPVKVLANGSLDLVDLKAKAELHKDKLAAFMVCRTFFLSFFGELALTYFCVVDHIPVDVWCV